MDSPSKSVFKIYREFTHPFWGNVRWWFTIQNRWRFWGVHPLDSSYGWWRHGEVNTPKGSQGDARNGPPMVRSSPGDTMPVHVNSVQYHNGPKYSEKYHFRLWSTNMGVEDFSCPLGKLLRFNSYEYWMFVPWFIMSLQGAIDDTLKALRMAALSLSTACDRSWLDFHDGWVEKPRVQEEHGKSNVRATSMKSIFLTWLVIFPNVLVGKKTSTRRGLTWFNSYYSKVSSWIFLACNCDKGSSSYYCLDTDVSTRGQSSWHPKII